MAIDIKLLQDLAPYSCAYGHMMSNLIYWYRQCTAYNDVLHTPETETLATYYERVMRSFLITKSISRSKTLVKNDMNIPDVEKMSLPTVEHGSELYLKIKSVEDAGHQYLRDLQKELRKENKLKGELDIRAEEFKAFWPDSPISDAMVRSMGEFNQRTDLKFEGLEFSLVLSVYETNYKTIFNITFWRRNPTKKEGFVMEISEAVNMFPEILELEWTDNNKN